MVLKTGQHDKGGQQHLFLVIYNCSGGTKVPVNLTLGQQAQ